MSSSAATSFSEYYKTISDSELLFILENKNDYQQAAIEAAERELERRQLSPTELENLKKDLAQKKFDQEEKKQKQHAVQQTVREKLSSVLESLNPVHAELPTAEKTIRLIIVIWAFLALYQLVADYRIEMDWIKGFPSRPFIYSILLFPYIMLPLSIYHLWRRTSLGWTLFAIYITYLSLTELASFYLAITWKPSGIRWVDEVYHPSLPKIVLRLVFVAGTFYVMCTQKIRDYFLITKNKMFLTVGITVFIFFLLFLALYSM